MDSRTLSIARKASEVQWQQIKRENNTRTERMELRDKLREEYDSGLDDVEGRYSQEDSDARA